MKISPISRSSWNSKEDQHERDARYIMRLIARLQAISTRSKFKKQSTALYNSLSRKNNLTPVQSDFIKKYQEIFLHEK